MAQGDHSLEPGDFITTARARNEVAITVRGAAKARAKLLMKLTPKDCGNSNLKAAWQPCGGKRLAVASEQDGNCVLAMYARKGGECRALSAQHVARPHVPFHAFRPACAPLPKSDPVLKSDPISKSNPIRESHLISKSNPIPNSIPLKSEAYIPFLCAERLRVHNLGPGRPSWCDWDCSGNTVAIMQEDISHPPS